MGEDEGPGAGDRRHVAVSPRVARAARRVAKRLRRAIQSRTKRPFRLSEAALDDLLSDVAASRHGSGEGRDIAIRWQEGEDSLVVFPTRLRVRVREGLLLLELAVLCDEVARDTVVVAFALPAGTSEALVVAAELPPRGPACVVDRWGEALVAFAWQTFWQALDTLARPSAVAGLAACHGALEVELQRTPARPPPPLDLSRLARATAARNATGGGRAL